MVIKVTIDQHLSEKVQYCHGCLRVVRQIQRQLKFLRRLTHIIYLRLDAILIATFLCIDDFE
jgi:hypothetical protein